MKKDNGNLKRLTVSAYILYIGLGILLKLLPGIAENMGMRGIGLIHIGYVFERYIYIPLLAVTIPLLIAWRYGFRLHEPASGKKLRIGCIPIAVFGALWIIMIASAWGFLRLLFGSPMLESILLNITHNLINGFGACVVCFFLIPRAVERGVRNRNKLTDILVAAGAFLIVCMTETVAGVPLVWALLVGLGCGFCAVYTRSLYLTYGAYVLGGTMFQQLSLDLFGSWGEMGLEAALIGVLVVGGAVVIGGKKNIYKKVDTQ